MWLQLLVLKTSCLGRSIDKYFEMKKIKSIYVFTDGSLDYNFVDQMDSVKNHIFSEKDFKNSKFCVKKKLINVTLDHDNLKFRHKFLK